MVVYADAFGETRTPARGGYQGRGTGFKWAMVFVTRRSRTTAVKLMRKEGDFLSVLQEYLAEYKARHAYYPDVLFMDNAQVNKSKQVKLFCAEKGIGASVVTRPMGEVNEVLAELESAKHAKRFVLTREDPVGAS